jgi:hypothetical protein
MLFFLQRNQINKLYRVAQSYVTLDVEHEDSTVKRLLFHSL